jgi:hypothetical protein
MKYFSFTVLIVAFGLLFSSCGDNKGVSLGEVKYYPSFLFSDSKIEPVTKTFDLEFSQDAKLDRNCYAVFQFVDNDGNPVSTQEMQITVDGQVLKDNKFRVTSSDTEKQLTFTFTPQAKKGKHQGYLKLVSHNLDRLDSQQLSAGDQVDAMQWTLYYNKSMNPLAKVLMWIGIALLGLLALWFLLLRWIVYKYIKVGSLRITEPYYSLRRIKGARQVVFTNKATKQGFLNRLFTGRIIYDINPVWTTPVIFESSSNGEVRMRSSKNFTIDPFDLILKKQEEYTLINEDTKERIKLTIY